MSRYTKLFAVLVAGYAFSPIGLIPDPISVLGYLDDLVPIPPGVALVVRMIPEDVLSENRWKARETVERGEMPVSRVAVVIVVLWLAVAVIAAIVVMRMVRD